MSYVNLAISVKWHITPILELSRDAYCWSSLVISHVELTLNKNSCCFKMLVVSNSEAGHHSAITNHHELNTGEDIESNEIKMYEYNYRKLLWRPKLLHAVSALPLAQGEWEVKQDWMRVLPKNNVSQSCTHKKSYNASNKWQALVVEGT